MPDSPRTDCSCDLVKSGFESDCNISRATVTTSSNDVSVPHWQGSGEKAAYVVEFVRRNTSFFSHTVGNDE